MTTRRQSQSLREIAGTPSFRTVDGVSIRFAESSPIGANLRCSELRVISDASGHRRITAKVARIHATRAKPMS